MQVDNDGDAVWNKQAIPPARFQDTALAISAKPWELFCLDIAGGETRGTRSRDT